MEIRQVKLSNNMTREEVNDIIGKWIKLKSEIFKHKENLDWECLCGRPIRGRRWDTVKGRPSKEPCTICEVCTEKKYREIISNQHAEHINSVDRYRYIRSYFKDDIILIDKNNVRLVKSTPEAEVEHIDCGNIYTVQVASFKDSDTRKGKRCGKCCQEYENSLEYYIKNKLNIDISNYWDDKENGKFKPSNVFPRSTDKEYYFKCTLNSNHNVYKTTPYRFTELIETTRGCYDCIDEDILNRSINTIAPNIAKMILYDENKNCVDINRVAAYDNKAYFFRCNQCNRDGTKAKTLSKVTYRGYYSCEFCSDGISIPEKLVGAMLKYLEVNYITQLSKKHFDWIETYRYDFFIELDNRKYIIETHGIQHYEETNLGDLKLIQENDKNKKALALKNGFNDSTYIIIDCSKSELEFLKNNITKALGNILDLSGIDWNNLWISSQHSVKVSAWNLYDDGIQNLKELSEILNVSETTIYNYLIEGSNLKKCTYNGQEAKHKNAVSNGYKKAQKVWIENNEGKIMDGPFHSNEEFRSVFKLTENDYYKKIRDNGMIIDINNIIREDAKTKLKDYNGMKVVRAKRKNGKS